ncbi:hypothetical protein SAMN02983003_2882 [Devosia enhydra]|uniref:Uncharacterized protein n=1 Tax=Devosia enhydra TaxID=665118 RepID=A0A1K2I060_9HYPH|nr:hypothetical protein [Devosia enhydra]SFZ85713.1 hypothetical protein SAMN02983003_2882 [Devosia enhydra]
MRVAALALLTLLVQPAMAVDQLVLTIENRSSIALERLNVFPIGKDGEAIEDNLGAILEDVPPGGSFALKLSLSRCETVRGYAGLAGRDDDVPVDIDLCKEPKLVLKD